MKTDLDRITVDSDIMNGQVCIRNMRITVKRVLRAMILYPERRNLLCEYPELENEDIDQALNLAARNLDDKCFL